MIRFLLKGILRDKTRSVLPGIIVALGVALTVFLSGYMKGVFGDMIDMSARFATGHVKVMSRAYAENEDQVPNDLALFNVNELTAELQEQFPDVLWTQRIRFGGLLDVPGKNNETAGQGPVSGMAVDLSKKSGEVERLNIAKSLVTGTVPKNPGEVLIGHDFAEKLKLEAGDPFTFFGSTMYGSMAFQNLTVSGTVRFGTPAMDRSTIIIDITDAQQMLDMENASGEILGYLKNEVYYDDQAAAVAASFNAKYEGVDDEFAPVMYRLKEQGLSTYIDLADVYSFVFVAVFVMAMSVVLWNTGLIGGLRRYQEYGIRLALGESKGHIFRSLIYETVLIGIIGSFIGTAIGLAGSYALQTYGIDFTSMMPNSTMMMPAVFRSKVTPDMYFIGFIPGVFSIVLGNALSGIGIYRRQTAELFKELEV